MRPALSTFVALLCLVLILPIGIDRFDAFHSRQREFELQHQTRTMNIVSE